MGILTGGRYAGKKALVVKTFDEGTKARPFPHCLVAGVAKAPLKVTKAHGKKKLQKRSKCKAFVKYVNYNHMMPTRYVVPTEFDARASSPTPRWSRTRPRRRRGRASRRSSTRSSPT